jgi:hypothetical protein
MPIDRICDQSSSPLHCISAALYGQLGVAMTRILQLFFGRSLLKLVYIAGGGHSSTLRIRLTRLFGVRGYSYHLKPG